MIDQKWDQRFIDLATHIAGWSKDPSTQQGAVITRMDKTIASMGFNGFPKGTNDDPALYDNREEKYGRVMHAELNALLFAKEDLHWCTLYTAPLPPCDRCAAAIVQSGIKNVCITTIDVPDRWQESMTRALNLFEEARVYVHSPDGGVFVGEVR